MARLLHVAIFPISCKEDNESVWSWRVDAARTFQRIVVEANFRLETVILQ